MSPRECFRLFVLFSWLLVGDVNCANTQRGYVRHIQTGQAPMIVHNDNIDYTRWSEPTLFRVPPAGYETSTVDRRTSGNINSAQEDHPSRVSHLKSGLNSASVARGPSNVASSRSENKTFAFPDDQKINHTKFDSAPSRIYHDRTKSTESFQRVGVEKASAGFGANNRRAPIYSHSSKASPNIHNLKSSLKPESRTIHVFPKRFHPGRTSLLQHVKLCDVKTQSPGSISARKVDTRRTRVYSGDVMSEAKGYTHVCRLKPSSDKTRPQASFTTGRKFFGRDYPPAKQNQGSSSHDSTRLGFGRGVAAPSERQLNSRVSQFSSRHPPSPDRAQIRAQGKFKPFQRRPANDASPAHDHFAVTTTLPSLKSTGILALIVTSTTGERSTKSASPMQTEG
ncbi:uncharacterized protein LOC129105594 [Anoplopoma fimbria]|uniref:uncharacterized protein LOC129105594 n=1 Tax=Anoplopoma fimbria TaxID=229290 RepID=UPI0023EE12C0|nr:uncharacterized protein LOC129105594 [Anoplopoma fimbria]